MESVVQEFDLESGKKARFHSLPLLEKRGFGAIGKLPVSIRVVLESLVRNCDGVRVRESDVRALAGWKPNAERTEEVPFVVARVLLQDFTGVPLLVDLAAMRSQAERMQKNPKIVEPLVPVDLVVDHSVQVDYFGTKNAFMKNLDMEFTRNRARYEFLKWGMQAFDGFGIVPPGIGIVHQVNLEYLAKGAIPGKDGVWYPDSLVGTDSHTTMVNGIGVVAWGVGGIEAEAAMLGQPVYFLTPDVVGVHLKGALREGVTATDLVLAVTELLRKTEVVGKFVEFHGEGAATLPATERATIANMAPEYGATMGFFPVDEMTCKYLAATGRTKEHVDGFRAYWQAQGMFGIPRGGECAYTQLVELDLSSVKPAVAGPKRPEDRIDLPDVKNRFHQLFSMPIKDGGFGKPSGELGQRRHGANGHMTPGGGTSSSPTATAGRNEVEMVANRPTPDRLPDGAMPAGDADIGHGDVVIAAITSCTNTSNPGVMLGAGLLAKKAVERGLSTKPWVKTSLAPGSRAVTQYLAKTGLQASLDQLGFQLVGYGCTTCIGNSGPLPPAIEEAIGKHDLVTAAVLSGNRNFEARVHQSVKANFLASPPLVVAFALAGRVDIDLWNEPIGDGKDGKPVFLKDIWPTRAELDAVLGAASDPEEYRKLYQDLTGSDLWAQIEAAKGLVYKWDPASTYVREPPYFDGFAMSHQTAAPKISGARALAIFGDSITTDHISPAGAIQAKSPAGKYLVEQGVAKDDFNSYGARRGNHEVMVRGTFANVRIKNLMVPGVEGGVTIHQPSGNQMAIYDAAMEYARTKTPLVILGGKQYGNGSSRDWAAKGPLLLGVRAVVVRSFERIHRSNLLGMGILPCQFVDGTSAETLKLDGTETYAIDGLDAGIKPGMMISLVVTRASGAVEKIPVKVRIDTPIEVDYYLHGGILPYVLRQILAR